MIILFRSLCLKQKQKKFFITLPAEDIDKKLYLVKKNKKTFSGQQNSGKKIKKNHVG